MYKFRTMQVNAEADGKAVWAQKCDPRTTHRRQVPSQDPPRRAPAAVQRPSRRHEHRWARGRSVRPSLHSSARTFRCYAQRQRVKPGITGWAQINQAYDSCLDDVKSKVKYDLDYVQNQSIGHDLRIMSMTLPVMLFRKGGW